MSLTRVHGDDGERVGGEIPIPDQQHAITLTPGSVITISMKMSNGQTGAISVRGSTLLTIIEERCLPKLEEVEEDGTTCIQVGEGDGTMPEKSTPVVVPDDLTRRKIQPPPNRIVWQ